jgi:hypothetical protein
LKSIRLFLIPLKASATLLSSSISDFMSWTKTFGMMLTNCNASNNRFVKVSRILPPFSSIWESPSFLLSSSTSFSFYKLTRSSLILFLFSSDMIKDFSGSITSQIWLPQSLRKSEHCSKKEKSFYSSAKSRPMNVKYSLKMMIYFCFSMTSYF